MTKEMKFFIYLLERYAEHRGETADVTYRSLKAANLVEYAIDMYELYHSEAIENAYADLDTRLRLCGMTRGYEPDPLTGSRWRATQ